MNDDGLGENLVLSAWSADADVGTNCTWYSFFEFANDASLPSFRIMEKSITWSNGTGLPETLPIFR